MFCCHVHTNGFNTCLLFARPRKGKNNETKLELVDFNENEVGKYCHQTALGPRWKQVLQLSLMLKKNVFRYEDAVQEKVNVIQVPTIAKNMWISWT